ncbi:MAG: SsrA-binding protein SmpB [Alphaproteobacteria bacterium]|nr:SsrA-binding protein SmpB [Alphaproteobacteria bacterium]
MPIRLIAQNRRARHDYFIEDVLEAGMQLSGSEVKSLREGRGSIVEAYAVARSGEMFLVNAHIPEYKPACHFGHMAKRPRKLLLHRREINRLAGAVRREGATLVPLRLYFNERGHAKLELGLARGKRKADKRHAIKERDWKRDKQRLMKARS